MKKVGWYFALALLLVTGFLGIANGLRERNDSLTALQQSVAIASIVYGVLGLVAAYALLRRRAWAVTAVIAWGAATTYTGTVATFAFHDPALQQPGTITGVIGAFVGTAAIVALVAWAAHVSTKPVTTAPTA